MLARDFHPEDLETQRRRSEHLDRRDVKLQVAPREIHNSLSYIAECSSHACHFCDFSQLDEHGYREKNTAKQERIPRVKTEILEREEGKKKSVDDGVSDADATD